MEALYDFSLPYLNDQHHYCILGLLLVQIYLFHFMFSYGGSSLLHAGFVWLQRLRLLFIVVCGLLLAAASAVEGGLQDMGFGRSSLWAQGLWLPGSRALTQGWWCRGVVAPWHVGSSQSRDWTLVPCITRKIPNHWTNRETLGPLLSKLKVIWTWVLYTTNVYLITKRAIKLLTSCIYWTMGWFISRVECSVASQDFTLLKMMHGLKIINYFWNFPFNVFGLWFTMG